MKQVTYDESANAYDTAKPENHSVKLNCINVIQSCLISLNEISVVQLVNWVFCSICWSMDIKGVRDKQTDRQADIQTSI